MTGHPLGTAAWFRVAFFGAVNGNLMGFGWPISGAVLVIGVAGYVYMSLDGWLGPFLPWFGLAQNWVLVCLVLGMAS